MALVISVSAPARADDGVLGRARRVTSVGLEAAGQGQHGHEHAHRARDAEHGHDGGASSAPRRSAGCRRAGWPSSDPPQRVDDLQPHGRQAGQEPGQQAHRRARPRPGRERAGATGRSRQHAARGSPWAVTSLASARPSAPPSAAMSSDSASTRPSTKRSEKPTVLSTASSPVRSRTAMAMVLPVTSSRVKNTTAPIARIRNSMLPICFTNDAAKAVSVWVRVSEAEFANSASMALATAERRRPGRSTRTTYQPTIPCQYARRLLVEVLVLEPELAESSSSGRVPR